MLSDADRDSSSVTRPRYALRWLAHAFGTTSDFFGLHTGILLATIVGPGLGYFVLAYVTAGSKGLDLAADAARVLLYGFGGTMMLFGLVLLIQILRTPAALEARASAETALREKSLRHELDEARAEVARLASQLDASRLHPITIAHEGAAFTAIDTTTEARDEWLGAERARYVEQARSEAERQAAEPTRHFLTFRDPISQERRTLDGFISEVRGYLEDMRSHWSPALRAAAIKRQVAALRLAVRNSQDVGVEGLEVQVTLPADIGAGWAEDAELDEAVPEMPLPWGASTLASSLRGIHAVLDRTPEPGRIERVDGRLQITWDRFDLSGLARHPLAQVSLFVPGSYASQTVPVNWTMASRRMRGVLAGQLDIPVAPAPQSPNVLLAAGDEDD